MEASTADRPHVKHPGDEPETEDGKALITEVAEKGAELNAAEESSVLDWLLGTPVAAVHDVPVQVDTPEGISSITFVVRAQDGRKLDEIEERHRNKSTGIIDRLSADCEQVARATLYLVEKSGRRMKLNDPEFLTVMVPPRHGEAPEPLQLANPAEALERRFQTQLGLISGVATQVRLISGYDSSKVGTAQRRLVTASLD